MLLLSFLNLGINFICLEYFFLFLMRGRVEVRWVMSRLLKCNRKILILNSICLDDENYKCIINKSRKIY